MATEYVCDNCHEKAPTLDGWVIVAVMFLHYNSQYPTPPGGRILDGAAPDLVFDKDACVDAWCAKVGVVRPPPPTPPPGMPPLTRTTP